MKGVAYRVKSYTENGRIEIKGAVKVLFENSGNTLAHIGPDDGRPAQLPIPAALEQNFNPQRPIDAGEVEAVINQDWKVEFTGEGTNHLTVMVAYVSELTDEQAKELSELTPASV